MVGHWIAFSLFLILIPIGTVTFRCWQDKRVSRTKKEKLTANVNALKAVLCLWLADLFYMVSFNGWLVWQFILGILLIAIIFYRLAIAFVSPGATIGFGKADLIPDFLIGIGLTVYLIYIVPDAQLQSILIPIVSAVYGGLITLVGVAWTIRRSDENHKKDEIERAKPVFGFSMIYKYNEVQSVGKLCFPPLETDKDKGRQCFVKIENSDRSTLVMESIVHDGEEYPLECQTIIVPGYACVLTFGFDSPFDIYLNVKDILGNRYHYQIKVLALDGGQMSSRNKFVHTVREITPATEEQYKAAIKEEKKDATDRNE